MAILKSATFHIETALLGRVNQAIGYLTGFVASDTQIKGMVPVDFRFPVSPSGRLFRLDGDRDELDPNYRSIWEHCTIEYDPAERGAEIDVMQRKMKLGPFMRNFDVLDLEKVIIHEFLHASLDDDWQHSDEDSQHGQIYQIIKYNLHYPGYPNPADPAAD